MIVCVCVVSLPQRSVAVQVLVTTYVLAHCPSCVASVKLTVASPQLSVAVSVAAVGTASHSTVTSAGSSSTKAGAVVS
ncbi:hypothetical protein [Flavobacterium sp.]|uniref:hypothetical protein n=1 Tax=Flavobacterium sp. TaxID=239 RepID=UPI003527F1D8